MCELTAQGFQGIGNFFDLVWVDATDVCHQVRNLDVVSHVNQFFQYDLHRPCYR